MKVSLLDLFGWQALTALNFGYPSQRPAMNSLSRGVMHPPAACG
jgi:hypothetical protein